MAEITGRSRVVARYRMARHAITRARERLGLDLTPSDLHAIREVILSSGPGVRYLRPGNGREIWAVRMRRFGRDSWAEVVFDRELNSIVTFKGVYRA